MRERTMGVEVGRYRRVRGAEHAEAGKDRNKPACLNCLASQLEKEFTFFSGRALVVRPAEGPPVHVFSE